MFETSHDWGLDPHLVAPEPGVAENLVGRAELSVEREEHTAGTKPGPELPDTGSGGSGEIDVERVAPIRRRLEKPPARGFGSFTGLGWVSPFPAPRRPL